MKLLDKIIKYFFTSQSYEEKNIDWKETALVFSEENIHLRKELKYWNEVADAAKNIEINEEKEKW